MADRLRRETILTLNEIAERMKLGTSQAANSNFHRDRRAESAIGSVFIHQVTVSPKHPLCRKRIEGFRVPIVPSRRLVAPWPSEGGSAATAEALVKADAVLA